MVEEERLDGSNYGGRRDNVISYVVSPIVSICGERRREVRVFGLKRPERRESGLRPQKA
jgi:hypothetical protein